MPRKPRIAPGGIIYHVLNRSVGRMRMFRNDGDFDAFDRLLIEAHQRTPMRILAYCIMSNHWHFVVWPRGDGDLTAFFRWLAHTHAMRWRVSHRTVGYGHLYQGRFKSFPIQRDDHLLAVCRYVERNPLTAGLVRRAQNWRHGSLWTRQQGTDELRAILSDWPLERPRDWISRVNEPLTKAEIGKMKMTLARGQPFGDDGWVKKTATRLHLEHTLRREGRPAKGGIGGDDERN